MKNYICSVKSLFLLTLVSLVFGLGINVQVSNAEVLNDGSGNFKILSRTSIQNPKLISQIGNNFVISFDMSNKENAQPDLKYGLQLIKDSENGQTIIDEKIFSEVFTLGPNETITREVNYIAPSYLVGEYSIWLIIENSSGLNQGIGTVGKVQLLGDDQYVEIDISSCYLSVTEDNLSKKYNLQQGVDVNADETLTINCDVFNKFDREISLKPQFEIFKRSSFSDLIEVNQTDENIVLTSEEEKEFSLVIPKNNIPQAYDVKLSFLDNGELVSNFVLFHYVLSGPSGTIQSIQMDKEGYLKDDIARIKLFWSGSADIFPDSRSGKNPADEMISFSFNIENDNGEPCIKPINKNLDIGENLITIKALIVNECTSLNGEGVLKDSTGKVLDRKVFSLVDNSNNSKKESKTTDYSILILICSVIVIIILIFILIKIRKKRNDDNETEIKNDNNDSNTNNNSNMDKIVLSVALSFLIGSSFFLIDGLKTCSANQVQAYIEWHFTSEEDAIAQGRGDEWAGGIWDDSLFTVGLGKDSYGIDEPLDVLATNATHISCGNSSSATVRIEKIDFDAVSPTVFLISKYGMTAGDFMSYGSADIPQNLTPGEHTIYFTVSYHHVAYNFTETIPVTFTVTDSYSCTDTVSNSTLCSNDDTDLTINTPKTVTN